MDCKASHAQIESLKRTLQQAFDVMLERLVVLLTCAEPTLEALERALLAELHVLGNVTLNGLCATLAPRYPPAQAPCGCGGAMRYVRQRQAQCKTLLGVMQLKRPYYLCDDCHTGACPLDRTLGLCAGGISAGLEALLALMGTEFSYSHAAALVEQLSLVSISAGRCRQATIALGECLADHEQQVRTTVWEQGQEPPATTAAPSGEPALDPLYVSADGVIVPTRETGWREQCVGAVYTTTPLSHRRPARPSAQSEHAPGAQASLRSQSLSYISELGARPAFAQSLWLEAHRRGLEQAKTVVFVGDGAPWLWQSAEELFPAAIQILDWYHASSYVRRTAQALYPADEALRSQWAEAQLTALWQSRTSAVIARLEALAADCTAAREALGYFTTNQTRMDYVRYRSLDLQVGSGAIESACKHVIQVRIKQAGMRWCVRNVRTMGKLRARLKSGRWEETLALRPPRHRSYHRQNAT